MRTGIYVYTQTTLNMNASESGVLISLDNRTIPFASGPMSTVIAPGIYKAFTSAQINVSGGGASVAVVIVPGSKDTWPDPPLAVVTAFNVTASTLNSFFTDPNAKSAAF
jgi:hypothetical protein